jgi:hypothetical protein
MVKLNYNSISNSESAPPEVRNAIACGVLIPFKPPLAFSPEPRAFLMTPFLRGQIDTALGSADAKMVSRWERLVADISHFVEGGFINWGLMKWLEPKKFEHWELRSVRPRPSLRVFGRFACADVFVGTHVVERQSLKGKWAIEWELEKLSCEDHWQRALGNLPPLRAENYEGYITDNATRHVRIDP